MSRAHTVGKGRNKRVSLRQHSEPAIQGKSVAYGAVVVTLILLVSLFLWVQVFH